MILTNTLADFAVTRAFTNLVTTLAAAGSARTLIQNSGMTTIGIACRASGAAPTDTNGLRIQPGEAIEVNAAQVWLKSFDGDGKVSVHTLVA